MEGEITKVFVVGPYPPPIHGMAKNTAIAANDLAQLASVCRVDISPGSLTRGVIYHATKAAKVLVGGSRLLSCRGRAAVYLPSDAGLGILYSLFFTVISRLRRFPVHLHHRSFKYIDRRSALMALLVRVSGTHTVHVFLCGCMKAKFLKQYPGAMDCTVVSNAKYVAPISQQELRPVGRKLIIGHLSNLGFEKGLGEVVSVARGLLARGHDIELQLAGPAGSAAAREFIEAAQADLGAALVWHGLVSGGIKDDFYRGLDYFLFPTRYENEAQPNVVFEAMSHGVPVIATKRGCLEGDLRRGGLLIADAQRYVADAMTYLEEGLASPSLSMDRKRAALLEITDQSLAAQAGYQELMRSIVRSARK